MNTDITRIDYRVEVVPRLCELIGIMDPRERQLQAISRICKLQGDVSESCLSAYCDHVLEQLNKGNTKELSKAEDEEFLKCLKALADLKEPEWKRVFSSKVFEKKNDITPSKVFERIYQGAVIEALKYSPQYDEGMSDDEILAAHGILSYSQTLEWKGAVEYCLTDRSGIASEEKIDTSSNYYGTVLNAQTLEHARSNFDEMSVEKIIVIENKANYESMEYDSKSFVSLLPWLLFAKRSSLFANVNEDSSRNQCIYHDIYSFHRSSIPLRHWWGTRLECVDFVCCFYFPLGKNSRCIC